jgi:carboxymethylenebutenolidase
MGEMIEFVLPGGGSAKGYLARAEESKGGIVIVQEWWGLNEQMCGVADRYAAAGYNALAPDLYEGRLTALPDEAEHLMDGLDWAAATDRELRGALQFLKATDDRVAVSGYCLGGALTVAAGVRLEEADVAISYYGIAPIEIADPAKMRIPFQGHFADEDDWCTPAAVDSLEAALKGAGAVHEIYRYDAKHAFANEDEPDIYDEEASERAWMRSIAFLKTHL